MSNKQALHEAEYALWVCIEHNALHHGENHNTVLKAKEARQKVLQALATTEPVMANGLTEAETDASASVVGLATTAPAVNQQLTTEPVDEREAFEKWITKNGEWPNNAVRSCFDETEYANFTVQGLWEAWQARAAMAQGVKG